MKKVSIFILVLVAMLVVAGCANDKENNNNTNHNINDNITNQQNENNNDDNDTNQANTNSGVMKLGETGLVDDEIGQYEITPTSFEIFKERDGISAYNDDEVFVLIDYTVKNISDEAFDEEDILGIRLLLKNSQGDEVSEITYYDYEFVDTITESIEPGQSYDSQLLFEVPESEASEYTLHFGSYSADVEDAEWLFTESEAK